MLDGAGEDVLRLGETVARIEQAFDRHAVTCPLLDLVEVAVVRIFLIRPAAHVARIRAVRVARPYYVTADAEGRICPAARTLPRPSICRSAMPRHHLLVMSGNLT
jgi:hypothetical protein